MDLLPPEGCDGQQDTTNIFLAGQACGWFPHPGAIDPPRVGSEPAQGRWTSQVFGKVRRSPPMRTVCSWQNLSQQSATLTMAFFDSDIVQDEAKRLFSDYQQLMQLGSEYGKFDREGKKKFIETMEELMGRYRVFMKRFELSEDFQAKLTVEQLRTQLSQFGITPEQMFEQMNSTLERMKAQIEQPPSS